MIRKPSPDACPQHSPDRTFVFSGFDALKVVQIELSLDVIEFQWRSGTSSL